MFASTERLPGRNIAAWLCSALIHVVAATFLLYFGAAMLAPPQRTGAALVFIPAAAPEIAKPAPLPKLKLRTFQLPKLAVPESVRLAAKTALIDAPVIQSEPAPAPAPAPAPRSVPAIQPPPPPQIRVGVLDSPTPPAVAQQTRTMPAVKIGALFENSNLRSESDRAARASARPAGFDTNVNFPNEPRKAAVLVASTGAFGGEGTQPNPRQPRYLTSTGSFGSASAEGNGSLPTHQQVSRAGFGDTVAARVSGPATRPPAPPPSDATPVEITFKPQPAYTDEARRLQIEGEVAIEAVFTASGTVEILRIVRGLGHGLNESALAAARSIRFRPATRHGEPVDSAATVRMTFELAY